MNLGELKTLLAEYMHRDDLTDVLGGFISLATQRIGRDLKSQFNQIILDPFEPTTPIFDLPSDYRGMKDLSYSQGEVQVELHAANQSSVKAFQSTGARPMVYSVIGTRIEIRPFQAKEFRLIYYNAPQDLVAADDTNEVLTNYPYLYLYASLVEAFFYTQDGGGRDQALQTYSAEVEAVNTQSANADAGARISIRG